MSKGRARNPNIFLSSDGTSLVDSSGAIVRSVSSYTWADFTDPGFDLTTARHVHISDAHSSPSGYGGSLWYVDPTGTANNKLILQSLPLCYATRSVAPDPTLFNGLLIRDLSVGPNGTDYISNGVEYVLRNGRSVGFRSYEKSIMVVNPAATFTSVTANNTGTGGRIKLAGAGVHGLTTAICVTPGVTAIYISGGGSWVAGLYNIFAITDGGSDLTLDSTATAPAGTPTVALVGTNIPVITLTNPPMTLNGALQFQATIGIANASASNLTPSVIMEGTTFYNPSIAITNAKTYRYLGAEIRNRNNKSSQITPIISTSSGLINATSASDPTTGSVPTGVTTTITLGVNCSVANIRMWYDQYLIDRLS